MARLVSFGVALVGLVALAACSSEDDAVAVEDDSEDALVDGRLAALGELASVVRIDSGCTATKVGPRLLLTAAHCIRDDSGAVALSYASGREVPIQIQNATGTVDDVRGKIEFSRVHPRITAVCGSAPCKGTAALAKRDAPDVAVIKLAKELPGVATMPIDPSPVAVGEIVMASGFGCTDGALSRKGDDNRLRTGTTTAVEPAAVAHQGSFLTAAEATDLANVYVYTAGPGMPQGGGVGLCPGDSGGPLVRIGPRGQSRFVGVHASYTFRYMQNDPVGKAVTNWHSRVDAAARHEVLAWLKAQGATIAK